MPYAAPRPCTYPGCTALARQGSRCPAHPYEQRRSAPAQHYNKWYSTARWRRNRKAYLAKHPICVECQRQGVVTAATVVDHVTPHRGDENLFWDQTNWQSLCSKHHNRKTARHDGGFGNKNR